MACENDDHCPLLSGKAYLCEEGLCQFTDDGHDELNHESVVQLCFDATPRPEHCNAQLDDPEIAAVFDLVDESCPDDGVCNVPASRRKP